MATNQKFIPPTYGPDILARQLQMMQNAERAKAQLEQGAQSPQGQMVSGHYVAPHWSQHLAQGLNRFAGEKAMQDLPRQQAELQNMQQEHLLGQFGFGQPTPQQLAQGLTGESQGTEQQQMHPSASQASMPSQMATQQGQGPMTLPGMSEEQSRMALLTMGPEKFIQAYAKQFEPTPEQRNLSHLPQDVRNQILTGSALSNATRDGIQNIMGADGRIYAVPVEGYAGSQANLAGAVTGAQEGAKAALDLVKVPDGRGGEITMTRSEAARMLGPQQQEIGASPDSSGQFGHMPSKETIEARGRVTNLVQQGENLLSTIDSLYQHDDLGKFVGAKTYLPALRGTERYDFERQLEQAQSQVFLEGYERLKGGGVITDYEGSKAEKAIARLDTGQTPEAFKSALDDLREVVMSGIRRSYENAGLEIPEQYSSSGKASFEEAGSIPTIASPDQLHSLPSGSVFRAPDGSLRRVP